MRAVIACFEREIVEVVAESPMIPVEAEAELWMKLCKENFRLQSTIQFENQRPRVEELFEVQTCKRTGNDIPYAIVLRRREESCGDDGPLDLWKRFFPDCAHLQVGPRGNLHAAIRKAIREGGHVFELRGRHQPAGNPDPEQQSILRWYGVSDAGTEVLSASHRGPASWTMLREIDFGSNNCASPTAGKRHKAQRPMSNCFPFPRGEEIKTVSEVGLLIDRLTSENAMDSSPSSIEWHTKNPSPEHSGGTMPDLHRLPCYALAGTP